MTARAWAVLALGIDLAATLLFVLVGRGNHNATSSILGLLTTWWPFVVALGFGWLVTRAWKRPFGILWPGVGIWIVTVAGGMLLRTASGQGTAVPFVLIATISVAVLLLGWRAIFTLVAGRSGKRAASREVPRKTERYP
ncbi:DUF3054 domain-containing protein [Mycetocola miduiensis]|uniref:DUF3054 domain-containing protein n=1 Tax=Mycetocola miduiensis TaxID=995034 RepID=A0A1I4YLI3_9MICO|nr:DUF3054 domain-containing protein [Mycetocola miduiensis]SFN38918.1 Protein of unknown function [Mycetocola miduiensis]